MRTFKRILVTGGAGFIGSAFVKFLLKERAIERVVNLDLLTYVANLKFLSDVESDPRYRFVHGDILSAPLLAELIRSEKIEAIVHFAAESHVDRSIEDPLPFYRTNVEGTIAILEALRQFPHVHLHHVSTDEVFGSIEQGAATEDFPYRPNSPYAASKAASDHFVRAYAMTYGLLATLSHSSNNYGPNQHREKFIPRMLYRMMREESLTLYGSGVNVRDWIHVDDHVEAIWEILQKGRIHEAYNVGGNNELRNVDLLNLLIDRYAQEVGQNAQKLSALITHVNDRKGHDMRYALSSEKIQRELGWRPKRPFDQGLETTIKWYCHAWR
jgi:dTDP-glucose 4,6-dehydratase